ncbi:hypothetical protein [Candidatus Parabeggiatoa sp. HSG14]|uniref:hypothetical protein n=1 Tax=Candidatus Parabeggiatoa sp. HSG14 TaxID=3055593 RepID=UPI0025A7664D|nr:hypothetical protein [Thiotrichales bacterium HSG14]
MRVSKESCGSDIEEVLNYLRTKIIARNKEKLQELITYIEKHQKEIIDYDQQKKAGKEIGLEPDQEDDEEVVQNQLSSKAKVIKKVVSSGRVEKAYDSVIFNRQKRKAMSFRPVGSRSLAILKVVELNHKWLDIWFPPNVFIMYPLSEPVFCTLSFFRFTLYNMC